MPSTARAGSTRGSSGWGRTYGYLLFGAGVWAVCTGAWEPLLCLLLVPLVFTALGNLLASNKSPHRA